MFQTLGWYLDPGRAAPVIVDIVEAALGRLEVGLRSYDESPGPAAGQGEVEMELCEARQAASPVGCVVEDDTNGAAAEPASVQLVNSGPNPQLADGDAAVAFFTK